MLRSHLSEIKTRIAIALLTVTLWQSPLRAQAPKPVATHDSVAVPARVLVLAKSRERVATGDTAGAAELLRGASAESPNDAVLWHEYGMLLSTWTKPYWRRGVMPSGIPQRFIAADSALARAMRLAPDSASYAVHYGQHLFASNVWNVTTAIRVQEAAVERAERVGDSLSIAEGSDAVGLFLWRRYEPLVNRRFEIITLAYTWADYVLEPYKFQQYIDEATRKWEPPLGEYLYAQALEYFRRARTLNINAELPFRHEAMALAERNRWDELVAVSKQRIAQRPGQMWPWMAMGVAEHRLGRAARASTAFDSAFARLPRAERDRLMSLTRLLPTGQQKWFDSLSTVGKAQLDGIYWNIASPSLLLGGNPVLDEYRARVGYAELMWTNEEMRVRGADSDRGDILVRWGPPDDISTFGPDPAHLTWLYRRYGLNFYFNITPIYGTANLTQYYRSNMLEPNEMQRPAIWANVPVMRRGVDSLPVQVARFRGPPDSMDVAVFAGIRAGALRAGLPGDTSVLKTGVFAINAAGVVQAKLTDEVRTGQRDTLALTSRVWHTRVAPSAAYLRVEALETDALRVARAIRDVAGFAVSGFGSSDLLVGARITPPVTPSNPRWSEFTVVPIMGNAIRMGQPIDLLWEVYEPAIVDGAVKYRVSIAVQRVERSKLVAVAAKLAGDLRDAVVRSRGNDRASDRVAVEYDRAGPGGPVRVEYLRLDLGSARAGRYVLTLEMRDLNSGLTVSRQRDIVLVER